MRLADVGLTVQDVVSGLGLVYKTMLKLYHGRTDSFWAQLAFGIYLSVCYPLL